VVDEHMFTLDLPHWGRVTARAQLFTGPGLRPVVVMTQSSRDECVSLINAAERYAEGSWRRFAPRDEKPPLWVSNFLMESPLEDEDGEVIEGEYWRQEALLQIVDFQVLGDYALSWPAWYSLEEGDLAELVGQPVDLTRGSGFRPPPKEPDPLVHHEARWLLNLPKTKPFRTQCMSGNTTRIWRRVRRLAFPRRQPLPCCWYHGGDWIAVCEMAVRLVRRAHGQGLQGPALVRYVKEQPELRELNSWQAKAFDSLFTYGISVEDGIWINGQHRAQAMMDTGVRRTILTRVEYTR
jgi:hypothetical protein